MVFTQLFAVSVHAQASSPEYPLLYKAVAMPR